MKQFDFSSTANRMRLRARSGENYGDGSVSEHEYIKKCSVREGGTTLVFTRDCGHHTSGWLGRAHDRCWHLSIACTDPVQRDAWLRAFFGDQVEHLWGQTAVTLYGQSQEIWHWRLFCDEQWQPVLGTNTDDLRAARMHRASELGVSIVAAERAA